MSDAQSNAPKDDSGAFRAEGEQALRGQIAQLAGAHVAWLAERDELHERVSALITAGDKLLADLEAAGRWHDEAVEERNALRAELEAIRAAKLDADPNAAWLTEAHVLCAEYGIPPGNLATRIKALRNWLHNEEPTPRDEWPADAAYAVGHLAGKAWGLIPTEECGHCVKLITDELIALDDMRKAGPVAAAGPAEPQWQPIETAPAGTRVLLGPRHAPVVGEVQFAPEWQDEQGPFCCVVHYNGNILVAGYHCSEWHPLPTGPASTGGAR